MKDLNVITSRTVDTPIDPISSSYCRSWCRCPAGGSHTAVTWRRSRGKSKACFLAKSTRLYFVDHLRAFLIILVIMHHLSIVYGASGSFVYHDTTNALTSYLLTILWYDRSGVLHGIVLPDLANFTEEHMIARVVGSFLRDRFLRLGIPLLIYDILIAPFVLYIAAGFPGWYWKVLHHLHALTARHPGASLVHRRPCSSSSCSTRSARVLHQVVTCSSPEDDTHAVHHLRSQASLSDDGRNAPVYCWPRADHFCGSDLVPSGLVIPTIEFQCSDNFPNTSACSSWVSSPTDVGGL